MAALLAESRKLGLRVAHHVGVEETNVGDDIKYGTTTIEHWYGIPDAAIESGRQNFPSSYNYNNEVDRFRYAGRLWREANPERLTKVHEAMVAANVAWDPTRYLQKRAVICNARRRNRGLPVSAPDVGRVLQTQSAITDRTSSAGRRRMKPSGKRTIESGWLRCASSTASAVPLPRVKIRDSFIRCTASD
jgi:hypothetical protein